MFQRITAAEVSKIQGRPEVMYYVVNADNTVSHYKWDGVQMVPALSASAVAAVNAAIAADRLISGVIAQSGIPIVHTGTLSATILAEVTIPANAMGANGSLRITAYWSMTNNANSKNLVIRFGGAATQVWSAGLSSVAAAGCQVSVHNRGATGSQVMNGGGTSASYGTMPAMVTSSEDTTQAQKIQFVGNLTNTGDTLTLERYTVEVLR